MNSNAKLGTELLDNLVHGASQAASLAIRQAIENAPVGLIPVIRRSCITCMHFNEQNEICSKFNARPPARIIALACPEYIEDSDIPF